MPPFVDEDGDIIPCGTCFERIGKSTSRDQQCEAPTGYRTRCNYCVNQHVQCPSIPPAANNDVRRMLEAKNQLSLGGITEEDFDDWYDTARVAISEAKASAAAVETSPLVTTGPFQKHPPAMISTAPKPQQRTADQNDDGMDIDSMGMVASLHAILRTLIKIDRRMESVEEKLG